MQPETYTQVTPGFHLQKHKPIKQKKPALRKPVP